MTIPEIAQNPREPENELNVQILSPGIKSNTAHSVPATIPKTIANSNRFSNFFIYSLHIKFEFFKAIQLAD